LAVGLLTLVHLQVTVTTGAREGVGAETDVFLTVCSGDGHSREFRLPTTRDSLQRSKTDVFQALKIRHIDSVTHLVVRTDGSGGGEGADWELESIKLERREPKVRRASGQKSGWTAVRHLTGTAARRAAGRSTRTKHG